MPRSLHRRRIAALASQRPASRQSPGTPRTHRTCLDDRRRQPGFLAGGRVTGVDYRMLGPLETTAASCPSPSSATRPPVCSTARHPPAPSRCVSSAASDGQGVSSKRPTRRNSRSVTRTFYLFRTTSNCPLVRRIDGRFRALNGKL